MVCVCACVAARVRVPVCLCVHESVWVLLLCARVARLCCACERHGGVVIGVDLVIRHAGVVIGVIGDSACGCGDWGDW